MWEFSQSGPAGYAVAALLIASALTLVFLLGALRRGRSPGAHWWLVGPSLIAACGELGVLSMAGDIDSDPAYAAALAPRVLALHSAGRLLMVSAAALGLSRALLADAGAERTTWRALLSLGAASVGLSVMIARDAASGGALAAASRQMPSYTALLAVAALLGVWACALTALRATPDAGQARASLGVAALGMLAALAVAASARTHGEALLYGGAPALAARAAALRGAALDLGQAVTTLIGLAALPALLATERSLFEIASPRRIALSLGVLALPFALMLITWRALDPPAAPPPPAPASGPPEPPPA